MAWDDTPPTSSDLAAPAWDAAPTDDELKPEKSVGDFAENAVSNLGRFVNPVNIAKGLTSSLKEGLYDIPKAAAESSADLVRGTARALTTGELPEAEDVAQSPLIKKTEEMTAPIAKNPVEYAYKNPLDTAALLATPFLALDPEAAAEEAPAEVKGALSEAANAPTLPTGGGEEKPPEIPPAAASLKDLPVMQPGVKTGEPHALFAYNDQFGPGNTPRSIYNMYGDPGHPLINQAGGYGSSVTKEILDKAGIPIVGREPRSVGKWEPIEEAAPAAAAAPPPPPVPPPATETLAKGILDKGQEATQAAQEVKDYINRSWEGFSKKPDTVANVSDWVQEKSQAMAAQQLGISPLQARQLGRTPLEAQNTMRAIGQYAYDKGIVSPGVGLKGMLEKNDALIKSVGKTIGDYRATADKLAGEVDPADIVQAVKDELDQKYLRGATEEEGPRGAYAGQAGAYQHALQELEDAEHSHSGIAEAATTLNKAANKAAKNLQPETPFTDVANAASRINNERVKALLGPEKSAQYEQALREFGVNKKIQNALKFKTSGEVKRFGPGSIVNNFTQKFMDEIGYRFLGKSANQLSGAILKNPSLAGSLPSLFKQFIHEVENVGNEATGTEAAGMYKGGKVPDDVRDYVARAC